MKAADYLSQKRARKRRMRTVRVYGAPPSAGPRVEVNTPTSFVMSGTTADIDTPQKRDAIARALLSHFVDVDRFVDEVEPE
jgi:hypothetical protein